MAPDDSTSTRRTFLARLAGFSLAGSLAAAYGVFAAFLARFLYPARDSRRSWLFVCSESDLDAGDSLAFVLPSGADVSVARQSDRGDVSDFVALSSTCPHLGCRVHWEAQNDRFFCPCHNGVFSPDGVGLSGPPGDAGQSLARYPLRLEGGLLYIEAPEDILAPAGGVAT